MVYRACTKRRNAAGKWIGGQDEHPWGWHLHQGKFWKNLYNRTERRYWQRYARAYQDDPEFDVKVSDKRLANLYGEVCWKMW